MPRGRDRTGSGRGNARSHPERQKPQPKASVADNSEPHRRHLQPNDVRRLLAGIGQPEPSPFKPDPFQLEALAALEFEDVLVTAPTGSGKTWIAQEEIQRLLHEGKRAWYTSPLKALTNSKYQEFSAEFGAEQVGILTGDRKENPDAPLIIGTT